MPVIQTNKITLVANTANLIMSADNTRTTAEIQNPLSQPVWISTTNPPVVGSPSWSVPPAIGGIASTSKFPNQSYPQQDWYAICSVGGDITVRWS